MAPKYVLEAVLDASWRFLGRLGAVLAPRWPQKPKSLKKPNLWTPQDPPTWEPKSTPNRSGSLPKSHHFFDCLWGRVLLPLAPNLAPTWPPKPSQNRSKLVPKSIKKEIKMLTNFLLEFWLVWGRFLINFVSKLEGRGTQKLWKTYGFLVFLIFRPPCQQEAIWSILHSTWPSTWDAKSTKNRLKRLAKSMKKGIENMMQVGLGFGALLEGFLVDLGAKLGGKLGPSWHQNPEKRGPKTMSKKWSNNASKKITPYHAGHDPRWGGVLIIK